MKLYLDVDGVLLGKNSKGEIALIPDIEEILIYTRNHFDCYWLTTHGRYGIDGVIAYIKPYFIGQDLSLLSHIKPLLWKTLKTEAIDFDSPFIWIDDSPLDFEIQILKEKGCLESWLHVDTYKDFNDLTVERLEKKHKKVRHESCL